MNLYSLKTGLITALVLRKHPKKNSKIHTNSGMLSTSPSKLGATRTTSKMTHKYCLKCGNKALPTMRMCPSCGAQDFDVTPPPIKAVGQHVSPSNGYGTQISGASTIPLVPAFLGARFIAYLIDFVILTVISAVPVTVAYLLTLPNRSQGMSGLMAIAILAAYVLPFVYFTVMPASTHQGTYGKKAMGLKLVTVQGERLSKAQAFIRVLLTMVIPIAGVIAVSLSFGGMAINYKEEFAASVGLALVIAIPAILIGPYLTVFFNPLKQTLFDMIVKTVVVKG